MVSCSLTGAARAEGTLTEAGPQAWLPCRTCFPGGGIARYLGCFLPPAPVHCGQEQTPLHMCTPAHTFTLRLCLGQGKPETLTPRPPPTSRRPQGCPRRIPGLLAARAPITARWHPFPSCPKPSTGPPAQVLTPQQGRICSQSCSCWSAGLRHLLLLPLATLPALQPPFPSLCPPPLLQTRS